MLGSSTPFSTQVRMARAGLNWTQHDLASRAQVSARTIKYVEADRRKPRSETRAKISDALANAGADLDGDCSVRIRGDARSNPSAVVETFGVSPMTFILPSDADPAPGSPTPVPSSPPDFLAQLTAAQQADARLNSRGRELTDQEFLGGGQPNGTRGATPDLSRVSDADLKAIATQGPSGATGRWSDAPLAHGWSSAPLAQAPGFSSGSDLSSVSDEALRKIAGANGTAAPRGTPATGAVQGGMTYDQFFSSPGGPSGPHLESDSDVGLTGAPAQAPGRNFDDVDKAFSRPTPFRLPSDADGELTDEQFFGTPAPVGPDVAKSAASGISSGVQGLIGMGGDIRHAADYGMLWAEAKIAEKLVRSDRLTPNTWSCLSTQIPPTASVTQRLGSGFGQYGSTRKRGTSLSAAGREHRVRPRPASQLRAGPQARSSGFA